MRTSEIKVGTVCFTKIGEARVEVKVVADGGGRGRRYRIQRADNGKILNSLRSAAGLHPKKTGIWAGCFGPEEPILDRLERVGVKIPDTKFADQIHESRSREEVLAEPRIRCPQCFVQSVIRLPKDAPKQTDGTTHICHLWLGGCNLGFEKLGG